MDHDIIDRVGPVALVAAPLLLLTSTIVGITGDGIYRSTLQGALQIPALGLYAIAIVAMAVALGSRAPRVATGVLVAGVLGAASGAAFGADVMHAGGGVERLDWDAAGAAFLFVPGIVFPLSLATAGIALWRTDLVSAPVGITLALGALAFPAGRAAELAGPALASDVLLLLACSGVALTLRGRAPAPVGVGV